MKFGDDPLSNERKIKGKYAKGRYARMSKQRHMHVVLVIFLDILITGVILLTFAFFHHVLPAILTEHSHRETMNDPTEPVVTVPVTEPSATEPQVTEIVTMTEPSVPETTEPDNRTEWQIKFADHFSDEVVLTENSYKSPEVSITIETCETEEDGSKIVYYVADIYIASIDNFTTQVANNDLRYYSIQKSLEMDKEANAIISICGDFITYQQNGFMMRNGEIYVENSNLYSICALYRNGEMETYDARTYDIEEIKAKDPLQVWSFGPVLLDENGQAREKFSISSTVAQRNPRSAVGYYEPGHYCFVVVDGRQKHSAGIKMPLLAQIFEELGCTKAYNLDGGGSAVMIFNHQAFSKQSNGADRKLGDLLVIRDSYYGSTD